MDTPDSVRVYFDAERGADPEVLAGVFCDDAVVRDEGGAHEGFTAIRHWWTAAKKRYQQTAMPLEMTSSGDAISVCAIVTGKFPNSPAMLSFNFTLRDRKIAELEIS
jgi:hypothetical protein